MVKPCWVYSRQMELRKSEQTGQPGPPRTPAQSGLSRKYRRFGRLGLRGNWGAESQFSERGIVRFLEALRSW